MSNKIRTDIFDITPEIGDTIIFNPPNYKGIAYGTVDSFSEAGLPILTNIICQFKWAYRSVNKNNFTPKTGFVVKKKEL